MVEPSPNAGTTMVKLRLVVTGLVLVLLPLVLSPRLLRRELRWAEVGRPDVISRQVDRYRQLVDSLPTDVRLGYLSDVPLESARVEGDVWFEYYQIARYALRPARLYWQPVGEWVVGQFEDQTRVMPELARHGLEVHQDFGDGVFLLRR